MSKLIVRITGEVDFSTGGGVGAVPNISNLTGCTCTVSSSSSSRESALLLEYWVYFGIESTMGRSLITLVHSSVVVVSGSVADVSVGDGTSFLASSFFLGVLVIDCGCLVEIRTGGFVG